MPETRYLGDGLYAEFDGYQFRLFTLSNENVYLEPSVFVAFLDYAKECGVTITNSEDDHVRQGN